MTGVPRPRTPLEPSHTRPASSSQRVGVYLDLENLLHPLHLFEDDAPARTALRFLLDSVSRIYPAAQLYGAANPALYASLLPLAQAHSLLLARSSFQPDASDEVLLGFLRTAPVSCDVVVVGSGDGIFAPRAAELAQDREVGALRFADSRSLLSGRLRLAVHRVVELPTPPGLVPLFHATPHQQLGSSSGMVVPAPRSPSATLSPSLPRRRGVAEQRAARPSVAAGPPRSPVT